MTLEEERAWRAHHSTDEKKHRYRVALLREVPDTTSVWDALTVVEFDSDTPEHEMADRILGSIDPGADYDQRVSARVRRSKELADAAYRWERHDKISGDRT